MELYRNQIVINHINLNGWTQKNKLLRESIINVNNPDIICVSETHLVKTDVIEMSGFRYFGLNRKTLNVKQIKGSGGVGILIKNKLANDYTINVVMEYNDNVLCLKLDNKLGNDSILLMCVYLPPEGSRYAIQNEDALNKMTMEVYRHSDVDTVVICGDFNARVGKKSDLLIVDGDVKPRHVLDLTENVQGNLLLNFVNDIKGCILNGRVTPQFDGYTSISAHKGKAVVDYFICRQSDLSAAVKLEVFTMTELISALDKQSLICDGCRPPDHSLLSLTIERSQAVIDHVCGNTLGSKALKKKWLIRYPNETYMESELVDKVVGELLHDFRNKCKMQQEVNECYDNLVKFVLDEANKASRSKGKLRNETSFKPYWDDGLQRMWKNMKECERLFLKDKHSPKKGVLHGNFQSAQRMFDKELKRKKRKYCKGQLLKIDESLNSDADSFWKFIKQLGPTKRTSIPMEVEIDGKVVNDVNLVIKKWRSDFEQLYANTTRDNFDNSFKKQELLELESNSVENDNLPGYNTLNCKISLEELQKVINKSKNGKAVGLDGIPNELLRHEIVIKLLHCLFNICMELKMIPDIWRKAILHLIPKDKSNSTNPLKYRGLSLQSCIFKLFCSVLNNRLNSYFSDIGAIADEQNGFRGGRSCLHHIFSLLTVARNEIKSSKGQLFATFIDFRKAFDYVDRDLLICKLAKLGVRGPMLTILKEIHRDTTNQIRLNGLFSESFCSKIGILQGNTASPTLFSSYIDGLIREIKQLNYGITMGSQGEKVSILAYADDIVLLGATEEELQLLLDKVSMWCKRWWVSVNTQKTKVMHFRKKRKCPTNYKFKLDGQLELVESYKYHLDLNEGTNILNGAASRALGGIISKTRSNYDLSYGVFTKLFQTCVVPILDYSSGAWSTGDPMHKLDSVQNRAIRFYSGLPRLTPILGVIGDMGWTAGVARCDLEVLRLYNQIVKMPAHRLTRKVFNWDVECGGDWSKNLHSILCLINRSASLMDRQPVNIEAAKEKLSHMYEETWADQLQTKPKLRTYRLIKDKYSVEPHLRVHMSRWKRSLISSLRCGVLSLHIETGRFSKTSLGERTCRVCETTLVEDEIHFLFECNAYSKARAILFTKCPELRGIDSNVERLKFLCGMPYTFSNFIAEIWDIRSSILISNNNNKSYVSVR